MDRSGQTCFACFWRRPLMADLGKRRLKTENRSIRICVKKKKACFPFWKASLFILGLFLLGKKCRGRAASRDQHCRNGNRQVAAVAGRRVVLVFVVRMRGRIRFADFYLRELFALVFVIRGLFGFGLGFGLGLRLGRRDCNLASRRYFLAVGRNGSIAVICHPYASRYAGKGCIALLYGDDIATFCCICQRLGNRIRIADIISSVSVGGQGRGGFAGADQA